MGDGDGVGRVGEGGRPLVCRDHQVGIVAVVANHALRRPRRAIDDVVGQVEHGRDEDRVGGDGFLLDVLARSALGQQLRIEAALGPGRHDDRVLDLLGFGQPQDLGPIVLCPVRPANTAAGDRRKSEVDALDPWTGHVDLPIGPRRRRHGEASPVQLEGDRRRRCAIGLALVEVGPDRCLDHAQQLPQDAILVEAGNPRQRRLDARDDRLRGSRPRLRHHDPVGIEALVEQRHEIGDDRPVAHQRLRDVARPERRAHLPEVAGQRPEDRGLAPAEIRRHDEAVEAIALGHVAEHRDERLLQAHVERRAELERPPVECLEQHVVQHHHPPAPVDPRRQVPGPLVDHREAQVLHQGHPHRQLHGRVQAVDRRPHAVCWCSGFAIDVDGGRSLRPQPLDPLDILERPRRCERLGVADREGIQECGSQAPRLAASRCLERVPEVIGPRAHNGHDTGLEAARGNRRQRPRPSRHDVVHAHQRPFREMRIERRHVAPVLLGEKLAYALAHAGREAVARHEHQSRDEAVEAVGAQEQAHPWPHVQVEDARHPVLQVVDADLEQLVARKRAEHVDQRLARVAFGRQVQARERLVHFAPQDRDVGRRLRVGARREQAHQSQLARQLAVAPVALDPDVVQVHPPMHPRHDIGLGDDQGIRREEELAHLRRHGDQLGAAPEHLHARIAQQAQPRVLVGDQLARLGRALEMVVASPEEREVALGQPGEKGQVLVQGLDPHRDGRGGQFLDGTAEPEQHRLPVVHDQPHLVENAPDGSHQLRLPRRRHRPGMDGDVAFLPAIAPRPVGEPRDLHQRALARALDLEDRVHNQGDIEPARLHFTEHTVQQERHVVVDDLEGNAVDHDQRWPGSNLGLPAPSGLHGGTGGIDLGQQRRRLQACQAVGTGGGQEQSGEEVQTMPEAVMALQNRLDVLTDGPGRSVRDGGHSLTLFLRPNAGFTTKLAPPALRLAATAGAIDCEPDWRPVCEASSDARPEPGRSPGLALPPGLSLPPAGTLHAQPPPESNRNGAPGNRTLAFLPQDGLRFPGNGAINSAASDIERRKGGADGKGSVEAGGRGHGNIGH